MFLAQERGQHHNWLLLDYFVWNNKSNNNQFEGISTDSASHFLFLCMNLKSFRSIGLLTVSGKCLKGWISLLSSQCNNVSVWSNLISQHSLFSSKIESVNRRRQMMRNWVAAWTLSAVKIFCSLLVLFSTCISQGKARLAEVLLPLSCNLTCCSVLQCGVVCCGVLQCAAVCYNVVNCVAMCRMLQCVGTLNMFMYARSGLLQQATTRCSMLQYVAVCCSVLQCIAACCSVLKPLLRTFIHYISIWANCWTFYSRSYSFVECCSVLQCNAMSCSMLQLLPCSCIHSISASAKCTFVNAGT